MNKVLVACAIVLSAVTTFYWVDVKAYADKVNHYALSGWLGSASETVAAAITVIYTLSAFALMTAIIYITLFLLWHGINE